MSKLRTPLLVATVYLALLGVIFASPSLFRNVFGSQVTDIGLMLNSSSLFFGLAVLIGVIATNTEKYGGLATAIAIAFIISVVFLIWIWTRGLGGGKELPPIVINAALAAWIWSARPKP